MWAILILLGVYSCSGTVSVNTLMGLNQALANTSVSEILLTGSLTATFTYDTTLNRSLSVVGVGNVTLDCGDNRFTINTQFSLELRNLVFRNCGQIFQLQATSFPHILLIETCLFDSSACKRV